MTEIFREIDEELRLEKLQRVWRRYGVLIVALAAGAVLGTAGYVGWQSYTEAQEKERGRAFTAALEQSAQADAETALAAFEGLTDGSDAYAALRSGGIALTPAALVIAHIGATLDGYQAACTPSTVVSPEPAYA